MARYDSEYDIETWTEGDIIHVRYGNTHKTLQASDIQRFFGNSYARKLQQKILRERKIDNSDLDELRDILSDGRDL